MAYITHSRPALSSVADIFAGFRAQIEDMLARRKMYNATFNELDSLTDRELADVGVSRAMIPAIAFETAYGN